jgi:hypothetical protein
VAAGGSLAKRAHGKWRAEHAQSFNGKPELSDVLDALKSDYGVRALRVARVRFLNELAARWPCLIARPVRRGPLGLG